MSEREQWHVDECRDGGARVHFQAPHLTHIFFVDGQVCVEEESEFTLFLLCPVAGTKASLGSDV